MNNYLNKVTQGDCLDGMRELPGGIVLDPFAGSGSTLIAAIETGRQFIGMELSQEYCDIAAARIKKARLQRRLF